MNKKLQLFGLLLVMLTTSFSAFAYDVKVDGLCYNLDKEKMTAELVAGKYTGDISIPASVTFNSRVFSVTAIGDNAFAACSGLTSITLNNSVTSIGDYAFYCCTGLTSIAIPDAVTIISEGAFCGCSGLTSLTIGKNVTRIEDWAFCDCSGLTSVNIPDAVTSLSGFYGCTGLTSVIIPDSVTSIGHEAFAYCTGLTSVTIPDSVTSIDDYAFYKCSGLTSVTIGKSVGNIGASAFQYCSAVASLYAHPTTPPVCGTNALGNISRDRCTLYVPTSSVSAYKAAYQWNNFYNIEGADFTGVSQIVCDDDSTVVGRYDINGRVMTEPFKGLNILKMSDGSTRKVWVE